MPFAPLPGIRLQWDVTTLPVDAFLRYELQRRAQGTEAWEEIPSITDPNRTIYEDYTPAPGMVYEYRIRQIEEQDGNEVASDWSDIVQASVLYRSAFLHAHNRPALYVEIAPDTMTYDRGINIIEEHGWGEEAPTGYVKPGKGDTIEIAASAAWLDAYTGVMGKEFYQGCMELVDWQEETGAVFLFRQTRDHRMYCQIHALPRNDSTHEYDVRMSLHQRVKPEEEAS